MALNGIGQLAQLSGVLHIRVTKEGHAGSRTFAQTALHRLREGRPVERKHELAQNGRVIGAVRHRFSP